MGLEVALLCEGLVAKGAEEGFFTSLLDRS
jgi:hypothetical protein